MPFDRRPADDWFPLAIVLATCLATLLFIALSYPFPSAFDELAHVSVARAQAGSPDVFVDTRSYRLVDPDDLTRWTADANFLNHPPLYYLLIAPLSESVGAMRLANVALTILALAIMLWAGLHVFREPAERAVFAILAASFPKTLLIGGMVNNDNLAMVAAALVLAGVAGAGGGAWLIALGLALAGWTKLTALIGLAALVAILALIDRREGLFRRANWIALAGAATGAIPYFVSLVRTGKLFHVNATVFASAPGTRPDWDFAEYIRQFFTGLANKWPAAEGSLPVWLCALLILVALALAVAGAVADPRVRRIGIAAIGAVVVTLALHFGFGWRSFETIGDLTIAQTRYYNVLWPAIALAATAAVVRMGRPGYLALLLLLIPTVPGGLLVTTL